MRRLLAVALVLGSLAAACGDDDDTSEAGSVASGDRDFCEIWPSLSEDQQELTEAPSAEDIARAREALDEVEGATPEEIEDEVSQLTGVVEGVLDDLEAGEDPSEELFGQLFAVAFSAGPKIEEWLVDNCPDYESTGLGSSQGGSEFLADDFEDGMLGVPGDALAAMLNEAFPGGHYGFGGGGDDSSYDWTIQVDMDADEALAACSSFAETLAEHPDLSGTLTFGISQYVNPDDPETEEIEFDTGEPIVLVRNAGISAGDPGACEPADS